jgi:hypothetical protein
VDRQRSLEFVVDVADHVEKRMLEVPLDVQRLVGHLRAAVPDLWGLPEARHVGREVPLDAVPFAAGQPLLVEGFDVAGDRAQRRIDGLAARLGRVGRERRLDEDVLEDPLDRVGVRAGVGEPFDGRGDAVGQRPVLLARADRPHPLALLGQVRQLEVRRERPGDHLPGFGVQTAERGPQGAP